METCRLCSNNLKFVNTPIFGAGKLKDGGGLCSRCYKRVKKKDVHFKINKHTLDEVKELLGEMVIEDKNVIIPDNKLEEKREIGSKTSHHRINKDETNNLKRNWEHCPRCGSNKVKKDKPVQTFLGAAFGGLAFAGCGIWLLIIPILGILIIILGGISFAFGVIMLILIAFTGTGKQLICSDCELNWEFGRYDNSNI